MTARGPMPRVSKPRVAVAAGICVGMISATRLDRALTSARQPRDPGPEPHATKEHQP